MGMKARTLSFEGAWGKPMSVWYLRRLYHARKITAQITKSHVGKPKPEPLDKQREQIAQVHQRVEELKEEGYDIIVIDESTFSPRKVHEKWWAPRGRPFLKDKRWAMPPYVSCIAAISERQGYIFSAMKVSKGFNA